MPGEAAAGEVEVADGHQVVATVEAQRRQPEESERQAPQAAALEAVERELQLLRGPRNVDEHQVTHLLRQQRVDPLPQQPRPRARRAVDAEALDGTRMLLEHHADAAGLITPLPLHVVRQTDLHSLHHVGVVEDERKPPPSLCPGLPCLPA